MSDTIKKIEELALDYAIGKILCEGNREKLREQYETLCAHEDQDATTTSIGIVVLSSYENDSISDVLDSIANTQGYFMDFYKEAKELE